MQRIEQSITINKPVSEVFSYASKWQRWNEWFQGVSAFNPTTETTVGNGARYSYKANIMGFSASVEIEIDNYISNNGWTGKSTIGIPHHTNWKFEPLGEGTKFTYSLAYRLPVPILGPIIEYIVL